MQRGKHMNKLKNSFLSIAAGLFLLAVSGLAADVDGKWNGTMATPMGDAPVAFVFKADGAKLTGSTTGPDGAEIKIADGKIDGAKLTFTVTFDFGGMPFMMSYSGVQNGNEIKFTIDIFGMPLDLVVKKST
jgi:hypothetical protein